MSYNPYEEYEPPVCFNCSECGDPIYHGDTMFKFDKIVYCESCMEDARTEAEAEEPDPTVGSVPTGCTKKASMRA